mgnify:CR=1 FL=1
MEIWRFIQEHDNGITNFHFEISADLLSEEELSLLSQMRPGLVQLEIGVQTTNPDTIREIRRRMDLGKLESHVRQINGFGNIHQHLDLIAGLPWGGDTSPFKRSFNQVYAMEPEQLQLGFLKVLSAPIWRRRRRTTAFDSETRSLRGAGHQMAVLRGTDPAEGRGGDGGNLLQQRPVQKHCEGAAEGVFIAL